MPFDFGDLSVNRDEEPVDKATGGFDFGDLGDFGTKRVQEIKEQKFQAGQDETQGFVDEFQATQDTWQGKLNRFLGRGTSAPPIAGQEAPAERPPSFGENVRNLFTEDASQTAFDVFKQKKIDEDNLAVINKNNEAVLELSRRNKEEKDENKKAERRIKMQNLITANKELVDRAGGEIGGKTTGQLIGQALGTALDLTPFLGVGSLGTKVGLKTLSKVGFKGATKLLAKRTGGKVLGKTIQQTGKALTKSALREGALFGGATGLAEGLKRKEDIKGLAKSVAFGTAVGGAAGGTLGFIFSKIGGKKAGKLKKAIEDEVVSEKEINDIFEKKGIVGVNKKIETIKIEDIAKGKDEIVITKKPEFRPEAPMVEDIKRIKKPEEIGAGKVLTKEEFVGRSLRRPSKLSQQFGNKNLKGVDLDIETKSFKRIEESPDKVIEDYFNIPEVKINEGKLVSVDEARELFPDYRKDRTKSNAVQEPASLISKRIYNRLLKTQKGKGSNNVLFTSGGTGVGKTSGIKNVENLQKVSKESNIILDTNLAKPESAKRKIKQALDEGFSVDIVHVVRDPIDALEKGALPRATRTGRTVPLAVHLETHNGSNKTIKELKEFYKDNPKVNISIVDNTRGKGNSILVPKNKEVDFLDNFIYNKDELNKLKSKGNDKVKEQFKEGVISKKVREGTIGIEEPKKKQISGEFREKVEPQRQEVLIKDKKSVKKPVEKQAVFGVETKPSKIAKSIEAKAIEQKLTTGFGELAEFTPLTIKEQAAKTTKLLSEDLARAKRIITGAEPLPNDINGVALITAGEEFVKKTGDADLAYKLANSPLVSETSVAGQTLRLARERTQDSATSRLKELRDIKRTAFEKKKGKIGNAVNREKASIKDKINKQVKPTRETWGSFVESIKCK